MSVFYTGSEDQADSYANQFGVDINELPTDTWSGFGKGLGMGAVKGAFVETGRSAAMAGSIVPIAYDLVTGSNESKDWYFQNVVDDTFNRAVDYWTPPKDVGMAGQLAGGIAGGIGQLALGTGNPSLMIANAQMGVGMDLVREGVDASTAQDIGAIAGLSTAVGAWLPIFGKTAIQKVAGNALINPLIGMAQRGASGAILDSKGFDSLAEGYNAWDATAILTDAAMGAAFGYVGRNNTAPDLIEAMIGKKASDAIGSNVDSVVKSFFGDYSGKAKLTASELDDVSALGNTRSMVYDSAPGRPLNDEALNAHTATMEDAINSLLNGEPVSLGNHFDGSERFDIKQPDTQYQSDFRAAANELGIKLDDSESIAPESVSTIAKPIEVIAPETAPTKQKQGIIADPVVREAIRGIDNHAGLSIDSAEGQPVSAKTAIMEAVKQHQSATQLEAGFKAAALCVLGG